MASRSISDLDPLLAYAYGKAEIEWILTRPQAPKPFLTCTYRDDEEQNALFAQASDGKDNNGNGKIDEPAERVTNARAGESPHNYQPAMAFDVCFRNPDGSANWNPELYRLFAKLVLKTNGITWGGGFKKLPDAPHFELTDWKSLVIGKPLIRP